jgi:hypothetical protein
MILKEAALRSFRLDLELREAKEFTYVDDIERSTQKKCIDLSRDY